MEKNAGSLIVLAAVAFLLIGGTTGALVGYQMAPEEKVVTREVEVPTTVTEEVEVEKEVSVEVPVADTSLILDKAVDTFLEEKLGDLRYCGNDKYDEDQILIDEIDEEYSIEVDEDEQTVNFNIELKYLDESVDEKCYNEFDVSVFEEEDEEPQVTVN